MSSFPKLDNLIDTVLNQVQEEPLLDQPEPVSMDEGMDSRIIIGITTIAIIGAIAIGAGLYHFKKEKFMEWYRSAINFIRGHTD